MFSQLRVRLREICFGVAKRRSPGLRFPCETLESRCLLSASAYVATPLVVDSAAIPAPAGAVAPIADPNLTNPWGIALSPTSPFWISDNGSGVATLYSGDVNGTPLTKSGLEVTIPGGAPTGVVFNSTADFSVGTGANGQPAPARFIFATENGQIAGWNPGIPSGTGTSTQAQTVVTTPDAVYKGLAIGNNSSGNFLYATNFHTGHVDVFDKNFQPTTLSGSFTDPKLPRGYAPFNIENLNGKLYVTYALQDQDKHDDVAGHAHGFVDVFDTNGNLVKRLISRGQLDSPWGMTLAPANFGQFSNDLLIGNFGNGQINAYNPTTGKLLGQLQTPNHRNLINDGQWGLAFGNGASGGEAHTLYFTAGPNHEQGGVFGKITPAAFTPRGHRSRH